MSDDRLETLSGEIRSLADRPVAEHADVLEQVHEALVDELEGLGTGRSQQVG